MLVDAYCPAHVPGLDTGVAGGSCHYAVARADAPPITLKLHHAFSAVSSVHDKFLVPWARKIEAETNGRIRIDMFPSMDWAARRRSSSIRRATATPISSGRRPACARPFSEDRIVRIAVRAGAPRAGQLQGAAGLRRDLFEGRVRRGSPALLLVRGSRRHSRLCGGPLDRGYQGPQAARADAACGRGDAALGAQPVPMPSEELPAAIASVVDGCIDPWHMVPPLRLNDSSRRTPNSTGCRDEPDLRAGDEQTGL